MEDFLKTVWYVLQFKNETREQWKTYETYYPGQKELLTRHYKELQNNGNEVRIMYHTEEEVTWGL